MIANLKKKYQDKFYRQYLYYTALETDLLFFIVCDIMFFTQVKNISMAKISLMIFLSIIFSLIVQYPLLKWINKFGNKAAVRTGSIVFLFSTIFMTFPSNYLWILFGGFLKCIGHTLNSIGTAILENKLEKDNMSDLYVSYQSDANSVTSFFMMITSLFCGVLFHINAYLPMYACIIFAAIGVIFSFLITQDKYLLENIKEKNNKNLSSKNYLTAVSIFISFAIVTSLSGIGLSYARINFQEILVHLDSRYVVSLLGIASTMVFLTKIISNFLMSKTYNKVKNKSAIIISILLIIGLSLQLFPWLFFVNNTVMCCIFLCTGYLLLAFVRDPYITLIQNVFIKNNTIIEQQDILVILNAIKKIGALLLSAICTILLNKSSAISVMILMTLAASLNFIILLCDTKWGYLRKHS